ncbi:hypothetical protein [Halomonas organivorans]|uniref:Putative nucleic acid-binding Zn-ribbon protein n=1 Tax=Halomonas organivorans TaxID=257772 RepID=A0A7W5BW34_9GAMM|nr:hypothetical protein [Halomonas organivorans]MBB3140217.1 putative nucleic acid-binding Zn-ribbon protein [Halomonas organivorans]
MDGDLGGIHFTVDAQTEALLEAERDVSRSSKRMERRLDDVKDESDRVSRSFSKLRPIAASVKSVAIAGTAAFTGLSAAMLVLTQRAAQSAQELTSQARQAGVSVEAYQQLAYAAKSVNVQQERLADIFRDSQDRVGDFLATGGGELADYFENIAPLVGQTAEEFRNLSGPQVLIKLQQGMDAANLSMEEQVFYLESVADEASRLQPLLTNNARALRDMAKEARDLNAVLSQSEVERLRELAQGFNQLGQQIRTETSRAVLQFDSLIKESLETTSEGLAALARGFNIFMDSFRDNEAKRSLAGINAELERLFDDKARLEARIDLFGENSPQAQDAVQALQELQEEYGRLIDRKKELLNLDTGVTVPDTLDLDPLTPPKTRLPGLGAPLEDEKESVDELGRAYRGLRDDLRPLEASQRQYMQDKLTLISYAVREGMAATELGALLNDLEESYRSSQSAAEAYGLNGEKAMDKVNDAARDLGFTFQSAFEDAVIEGEDLRSVLQGIAKDIARITLRRNVTEPLGNAIGGFDWGGMISGLFGWPSAGTSFGSSSGVSGMAIDSALSVAGGGSWANGGYTGDGSKHDVAGIVHRGEFVMPKAVVDQPGMLPMLEQLKNTRGYLKGGRVGGGSSAAGSALGGVEVHIHNEGGEPMQVGRREDRQGGDGRRELHLWVQKVVDQRMRKNFQDGSMDRQMKSLYGVQR